MTRTNSNAPTSVLISGLPSGTPDFAISLYAENLGANVESVHLLPSNQAIVKLLDPSGKVIFEKAIQ